MKEFVLSIITLSWKDILLELRTKDAITGIFMFSVLTAIIFNFAFAPSPTTAALVIPGVLWVSIIFAGVLGFNRSFVLEKDRGSIDGLLLCPVSRDVIYFGKVLGMFVFMTCVEIVLLPVFSVLYNVSLINIEIVLIIVLATLGFAGVGTLFSAMAVNTRSRDIMLPVLLFPVCIPLIIAAVEATMAILDGSESRDITRWAQLMLAFDVVFLIVPAFVFSTVLEE